MKREKDIYVKIIDEENIAKAIDAVNKTHRWNYGHKPNRTVLWVESTKPDRIVEIRAIIEHGFIPSNPRRRRIFDQAAWKWRDICEPRLYPDQYIHHAVIQALTPIMMKGMDRWCCGSIRGRGTHYGARAIKKWMKNDIRGTKYALELDIKHFYDSIKPQYVMDRMRQLIKDGNALRLIETLIHDGILIGCYFSQWFANTLLQPLDRLIRESGLCSHYLRYMDNFSIFGSNKRKLKKLFHLIEEWLNAHDLQIKENWQLFRITDRRIPNALGYRYGRGFTFIRKNTLLRIKRKLKVMYRTIDFGGKLRIKTVNGMISRLGQLKHCNSKKLRERLLRQNFVRMLKNIVRKYQKSEVTQWNTVLQKYMERKSFVPSPA